jgi:hypothetical protein
MHVSIVAALTAVCVSAGVLSAQAGGKDVKEMPDPLLLDLATAASSATDTIVAGRYVVQVVHAVPNPDFTYTLKVADLAEAIPPLAVPEFLGDECKTFSEKVDALKTETRESQIESRLQAVADARGEAAKEPKCGNLVTKADAMVARTMLEYPSPVRLRVGRYIRLTVTRVDKNGKADKTWVQVWSSGGPGEWRVGYGFAFPLRLDKDPAPVFFTKAVGKDTFVVTPEKNRSRIDVLPSVFFNFTRQTRDFEWNWLTAGLGLDLKNPAVMLGTGFTYWSNLQLTAGVVVRHEQTLGGKFDSGDTVATNLGEDELNKDVFKARPFIALALRFSANPFKSGAGKDKEEKPEEKNPGTTADSSRRAPGAQ